MNIIYKQPKSLCAEYRDEILEIKNVILTISARAVDDDKLVPDLESAQKQTAKLYGKIRKNRKRFMNSDFQKEASAIYANLWNSCDKIELAIEAACDEDESEFKKHLPVSTEENELLAVQNEVDDTINPFSRHFVQDEFATKKGLRQKFYELLAEFTDD